MTGADGRTSTRNARARAEAPGPKARPRAWARASSRACACRRRAARAGARILLLLVTSAWLWTPATVQAQAPTRTPAAPGTAPAPAAAATATEDPDLTNVRRDFGFGNFEKVLQQAQTRIDHGNLSQGELRDLHLYAGLAAHALKRLEDAGRHLAAVLRIDPDYSLDPYVTPPQAILFFEKLRKQMDDELEVVRRERRIEADRLRREATDREARRVAEEEQRRRLDQLSRRATVQLVEKRSYAVNFIPFGAGQFQQGRGGVGTLLASVQGALAATSVVAYLAFDSLYETRTLALENRVTPDGSGTYYTTLRGIPRAREVEARNWRLVKYGSATAFYVVYAVGVADALWHHQDEVITTRTEEIRVPGAGNIPGPPGALAPELRARPPSPAATLRALPLPLPGGFGAGLSGTF